jgi:hypothetical protein
MKPMRNNHLFDVWSLVHVASGVAAGWLMPPFIAFSILVLWEPFEILLLSPLLARYDIVFGHESLRNSLSDIVFNFIGVVIGTTLFTSLIAPPFYLFG